jgi:formylglycine-generating enzyme required for sulfatase activity
LAAVYVTCLACAETAPPRAEFLVFVDTDTPVAGLALRSPRLADASIDSLHVDVIDAEGFPYATRDIVASNTSNWPVSFGIKPPQDGSVVHLRMRGYRSDRVLGDPTSSDYASVVIDRLADLPPSTSGVEAVEIVLHGDCFGVSSSLVTHQTCSSGADSSGAPSDGVVVLPSTATPTSVVGRWGKANPTSCEGDPPEGSVCIPGGVTFLGDTRLTEADSLFQVPAVPLRPVAVSAFFLDKDEFTVGRLRPIVSRLSAGAPPGASSKAGETDCTWLGPDDSTNDALPVNCVTWNMASEACGLVGGALPTEAEWEHAARGGGSGWTYPWGLQAPACCSANVPFSVGDGACPNRPVMAPGSFATGCGGVVDVSLDRVFDLDGNVLELVADTVTSYADPCWGTGVPVDPICPKASGNGHISRGGTHDESGPTAGVAAVRWTVEGSDPVGFRCAYPGAKP